MNSYFILDIFAEDQYAGRQLAIILDGEKFSSDIDVRVRGES